MQKNNRKAYMTTKKITLNADKRKVIADVFQDHFESNSKYKKAQQEAKETYNNLREQAKVKINELVRFHQPQEDVDTIRSMISKYGNSGGDLYLDNCFHVQTDTPKLEEDYHGNKVEKYDDVHIKFDSDKEFLTSYYLLTHYHNYVLKFHNFLSFLFLLKQ